ncbi:MAG: hypothetical protein U1E76_14090 [Planctomycetota bacterium]
MQVGVIVNRIVMLAVTTGACAWLTARVGAGVAVVLWTVAMTMVCAATALLLERQPAGRVSLVNRVAGLVLPWGYRLGRGRLAPIVVTSCVMWALLGLAATLAVSAHLAPRRQPPSAAAGAPAPSVLLTSLLYAAWLVDGAALLHLIGVMASSRRRLPMAVILPALALAAMVLASIVLALPTSGGHRPLALLIAGGPPLLIGLSYGAFVLVMVVFGRHTSWH